MCVCLCVCADCGLPLSRVCRCRRRRCSCALEQTRLLQKFRAKQHSAAVSSNIGTLLDTAADEQSHGGNTTRLTAIGATFQTEEATTDVVEERMRQYIEEQVEKRRQASSSAKRPREEAQASLQSAADDAAGSEQARAEAAVLNDVAPLLRRKAVLDEKDEASAERWLRGIAEVQLPMEHRMHNVERTEAARARLEHSNRTSTPLATQTPGALPTNYNSNFAQHKKEVSHACNQPDHCTLSCGSHSHTNPSLASRVCACHVVLLCMCSGTARCVRSGRRTRRRWRGRGQRCALRASRWRSRKRKGEAEAGEAEALGQTPHQTAAW